MFHFCRNVYVADALSCTKVKGISRLFIQSRLAQGHFVTPGPVAVFKESGGGCATAGQAEPHLASIRAQTGNDR